MSRCRFPAAAVVALSLLLPATPALASAKDVLMDCSDHGQLTKQYSQKEYRQALAQMPADLRQYTDCESLIKHAQLGEPPATDPAANSGNAFGSASPEVVAQAQKDIEIAKKTGGSPQKIAGDVVYPGALAYTKVDDVVSKLPTPLLVLAALITAAGLAVLIPKLLRRRGDGGA